MIKLWMLTALAAASLAAPALAQEKKTIVIATDATWPPFEFVDESKALAGFSVEYMQAAAAEGGYEVKIIKAAWDGIFAGLINKQYDAICSSVSITGDRLKSMDFSDPYFTVSQAVLVPQNSPVKTPEDLKGRTVGSQLDTTGTFAIDKIGGVTSKTYDEIGLAVEDLYSGRLDAVVCDDAVASNFILENAGYNKTKFKIALILDSPGSEELYGVAVRKGDGATLELINKGIAGVKARGIDKELQKKWIASE